MANRGHARNYSREFQSWRRLGRLSATARTVSGRSGHSETAFFSWHVATAAQPSCLANAKLNNGTSLIGGGCRVHEKASRLRFDWLCCDRNSDIGKSRRSRSWAYLQSAAASSRSGRNLGRPLHRRSHRCRMGRQDLDVRGRMRSPSDRLCRCQWHGFWHPRRRTNWLQFATAAAMGRRHRSGRKRGRHQGQLFMLRGI